MIFIFHSFSRHVMDSNSPMIAQFDSAMLCYWSANNLLTLTQTAVLKQKSFRTYFGIWERPKPVPGAASGVPSVKELMERLVKKSRGQATSVEEEMERHNQAVETKKNATRMMDAARDKRRGITGKRNE
jgi:membrane protein insertase Oxa1/YidC/SpoIIIJ